MDLARRLAIEEVPDSWRCHAAEGCGCDGLLWEAAPDAVGTFGLPADVEGPLDDTFARIRADADLRSLADLWHFLICHLPGDTGDNPSLWPLPVSSLGSLAPLFPLAVLVSGAGHARDAFRRAGASEQTAAATLGYAGYFVRDYRRRHGRWGLAELGWLRVFVRAELFQLGRLSFRAVNYDWPFRVYRNCASGDLVTLCEPRNRFRADGLADGCNGVFDPCAWSPTITERGGVVSGHPVSGDGRALAEPVELDIQEWELALGSGCQAIEVHIPAESGRLSPGACADSFRQAAEFYGRRDPPVRYAAFTCWSWLLDPGLARIIPPESNIVRFQRLFRPVPVCGDESQAYDLVFGSSSVEPARAPGSTFLQRAIAEYVASGNRMRSSAGFVLWDEIADWLRSADAAGH